MKKYLAAVLSVLALAACEPPAEAIRTVALSEIARAQAAAGDMAGARKTAALAAETAQAVTGDGGMAVGSAAVARSRAGDASGALDLANTITDARSRALALVLIAVTQAEAGKESSAAAVVDRALDVVERISNAGDRDVLRALAAWALALADDAVGTEDSLAEIADPEVRAEALARVSRVQVEAGDTPAALETARRIPSVRGGDADVMIMIAQAIAVDVFRAFDSVLLRWEVRPRIRALVQVAAAQAEAGETTEAERTYDLASEAARAIEDSYERDRALKLVEESRDGTGHALSRRPLPGIGRARGTANLSTYRTAISGDPWATAELLELALETAADPVDRPVDPEQAWIVARLAAALADAGDAAEARATALLALEMVQESPRFRDRAVPLLFIAAAQARAGDIDGALATARRIVGDD